MEEHLQYGPNSYRSYICSGILIGLSILMIFGGIINIGIALTMNFSNQFNEGFPEDNIQMNAGIGFLVPGVVVMILSITWRCYVRHNQYTSALPAGIRYTPEQTAVNHLPVAQFAINQLPPAQLSLNQLPPAQTAINRYTLAHAYKPPPSYNEVMGDLR